MRAALSKFRRCSASALVANGKSSRQFRSAGSTLERAYTFPGEDSQTEYEPATLTTKYNSGVSTHAWHTGMAACNRVSVLHCEQRAIPSPKGTSSPAAKVTF